jgi:hypothetical protein
MDGFQLKSSDDGALGPGSDVANSDVANSCPPCAPTLISEAKISEAKISEAPMSPAAAPAAACDSRKEIGGNPRLLHLIAAVIGFGLAFLVSTAGGPGRLWGKIGEPFPPRRSSTPSSASLSDRDLDHQGPQRQAEILLERAVTRSSETSHPSDAQSDSQSDPQSETQAQIQSRLENWRGKLTWNAQLGQLTTAALNSNNRSVRESAIEVQLAAYGLPKIESSVDTLVRDTDSADHARKIWALWALGLLGNRGIETDRVVQVLTAHLKNSGRDFHRIIEDEDTRGWAVESLAMVGTTPTVALLLEAMHNDPSPAVRERAACSLAESGMLSHEQRLIAVPQLIHDSDDPALDAQTHAWAFDALADITQQHLPNDSAAWRTWYEKSVASEP